jgi:hypothetical protein
MASCRLPLSGRPASRRGDGIAGTLPPARRPMRILRVPCHIALSALVAVFAGNAGVAQSLDWSIQFGSSLNDSARAVAPDGSGGVLLGGSTRGRLEAPAHGNYDAWVARLDGVGNLRWLRQFGTSSDDGVSALIPDGMGGAFVTGICGDQLGGGLPGFGNALLARFDGEGNRLWVRNFGSYFNDSPRALATDGAGGVYVCGRTQGDLAGPSAGAVDAWLARFDGSGQMLWSRQLGTLYSEECTTAVADGAGGVIVSGWTEFALGGPSAGGLDVWVARFDSSGTPAWVQQFGTPETEVSWGSAADGAGGFFLCGHANSDLGGPSKGYADAWIARFDGNGSQLWIQQLGTDSTDVALSVAFDGDGGVAVSGHTQGDLAGAHAGDDDIWLARYDLVGNVLWSDQIGTSKADVVWSVAADEIGGVLLAGSTYGALAGEKFGMSDVFVARYDISCNPGTTYCTASATSIPGCQSSLSATGSPTLSSPTAWTVSSGPVPGGNLGLLLFGSNGKDNTPYGTLGGQLCVAAPTLRTAPKSSGGDQGQCNGSYAFTLADLIAASPIVTSGTTFNAQVWARDPANQDGFLLSDGIEFTVCP